VHFREAARRLAGDSSRPGVVSRARAAEVNENIGWPKRRGDTTQFVPIESLAGEPCRIKLDPKSPPRE
jgi:hypothetical protein